MEQISEREMIEKYAADVGHCGQKTTLNPKITVHWTDKADKTLCGIRRFKQASTDTREVTCKRCIGQFTKQRTVVERWSVNLNINADRYKVS